jgi:hypothetical protein
MKYCNTERMKYRSEETCVYREPPCSGATLQSRSVGVWRCCGPIEA